MPLHAALGSRRRRAKRRNRRWGSSALEGLRAFRRPTSLAFMVCAACVAAIVLCFAEVASRFDATGGPPSLRRAAYGFTAVGFYRRMAGPGRAPDFLRRESSACCRAISAFSFRARTRHWCARSSLTAVVAAYSPRSTVAGVGGTVARAKQHAGDRQTSSLPLGVFVVDDGGFFLESRELFVGGEDQGMRDSPQSVLLLVYAFTGFEMAVIPAGEARHPGRNLPVALLAGMTTVILFYVAIQVVCIPDTARVSDLAASGSRMPRPRFLGSGRRVRRSTAGIVDLAGWKSECAAPALGLARDLRDGGAARPAGGPLRDSSALSHARGCGVVYGGRDAGPGAIRDFSLAGDH